MTTSANHQSFPPIVTVPDPRLRQKSEKVHSIDAEVKRIIREMIASSLAWEKDHAFEISAAMAAPQLGYNKRIIIVRDNFVDKDKPVFVPLINPEVIKTEGKIVKTCEGCLSVPKIYGKVPRADKVRIKALTENGDPVQIRAHEFLARTLLHEIDHLNGILFIDRIKDQSDAFFELNDNGDLVPIDYATRIKDNPDLFPAKTPANKTPSAKTPADRPAKAPAKNRP